MRILVSEFVSLDGVVQAPGGAEEDIDGGFEHGGWSMPFFDPAAMGPAIDDAMSGTDALLFGRRTWRTMADAWPGRAGDPFADRMNAIPKYVVSTTLTDDDLDWENTILLDGRNAVGEVRRLRERDGRDLHLMGSPTLAAALIAHDLVGEYQLMIVPVTLGGGKRLFPDDGRARPLELVSSAIAATGVHIVTYRPKPARSS